MTEYPERVENRSEETMHHKNIMARLRYFHARMSGRVVARDASAYQGISEHINNMGPEFESKSDEELKCVSRVLKGRIREGEQEEDILIPAFALVREAIRRALRISPFDVQVLGGIAMHRGKLVEMQTGEGKTLTAVFPAYLHALSGMGVHILTFNDYLAKRDARWMGPVYNFLGMKVGYIEERSTSDERRTAYGADVTYITAKQAGFDYLRTQLCFEESEIVQRPFHLAIVDEADSILIDEARIPLVIAGNAGLREGLADTAAAAIRGFRKDIEFETDEYGRNIIFTEAGTDAAENALQCGNLYAPQNLELLTAMSNALHAEHLLRRDIDYIVRDGKIELVDEFTGRVVKDRHWPDGLSAAIESKEGLTHRDEGRILGSITLQHFLQLYPKICGMTATAQQAVEELKTFYDLEVVVIPPNRPCIRRDEPDIVFTDTEAKFRAIAGEIKRVHSTGRPILAGTISIRESERLADALRQSGLSCEILNAKNDENEAEIIANAGATGAITISTNMAGRGTDIKLGGRRQEDYEAVKALGGLYIIGTNRHESKRIDNQLRGRAGRQGDPGESRFFISLEDDLIVRYGIDNLIPAKYRPGKQDGPVDNPVIRREIARAQRIIEGQNLEIRKTLFKYSGLVEKQRLIAEEMRHSFFYGLENPIHLNPEMEELHENLAKNVEEESLAKAERLAALYHIDRLWAQHLAYIAHVKEGIHLVSLGGGIPLNEFCKAVTGAFQDFESRLSAEITTTLKKAKIASRGIDLDREGIRGPSSTWTYLVGDDAFADSIGRLFYGLGGSYGGFAAVAAMFWPLLMASAAIQKLLAKRSKNHKSE